MRISLLAALAALVVSSCGGLTDPGGTDPGTTDAAPTTVAMPAPRPSQKPPQTIPLATLPPRAAVCDAFADVTAVGELKEPDLKEISGIVSSRRYPQVLWAHNDSRGGANVYAINTDGTLLATWQLDGVIALDWEDIAAGPGPEPGVTYLYVGDIGDNFALRSEIVVYRFPEPDVIADGVVTDFEVFRLSYPDPGPNAEAMAVDPVTGDLLIFTKDRDGPEGVWRAPGNELRNGLATRLEPVAILELGNKVEVTAADITSNGDRIALRGYDEVWIWPRLELDLVSTFAARPCEAASPDERQGESLAFDPASLNLYTISEGTGAAVNRIAINR
jgi:hypothetical protein